MIQKSEAIKSAVRLKMIEKITCSLRSIHGDLWSRVGNDLWADFYDELSKIKR